jgi:DtxR family Mn-dependent transcriptional regulator
MELKLSESQEDYLEAIYDLMGTGKEAGVTAIASSMNVKKPSVTAAMKILARKGLVVHDSYESVKLTVLGKKRASGIAKRHEVLRELIEKKLGFTRKVADRNACKMEHALDADVLAKLILVVSSLEH